jgi:uncharacterized protein (TIGR01244 family)
MEIEFMENSQKINDELTVAAQITLEQLQEAAAEGIKSILNLRSPDEEGFWLDEQQQVESLGLRYINLPVKVDMLTEELATEVLQQIDVLPKPVLVHCGVSMRAGAMALMNVATRHGLTPEQAFEKAHAIGFDCSAYPKMKEFFEFYVTKYAKAS